VRGGRPRITAEPAPVGTTPQSFTLEYATLYPGDARFSYRPSATQLTEQRGQEGFSNQATPAPIITDGKKSTRNPKQNTCLQLVIPDIISCFLIFRWAGTTFFIVLANGGPGLFRVNLQFLPCLAIHLRFCLR
jgi:hypothetical protein